MSSLVNLMPNLNSTYYVVKRDGRKEPVHFDKITNRINKLLDEKMKENVDVIDIVKKTITSIYPGITTKELDEQSSYQCAMMATKHPDYSLLAGRITVSSLHKETRKTFVEKMEYIQKETGLFNQEWLEFISKNRKKLNKAIDYNKDFNFDYFGVKTMEKIYLTQVNKKIVERPQDCFMRVASLINMGDLDRTIESYQLMSDNCFTHASPTLFNAGNKSGNLVSCFLLGTEDSIEGITKTWHDVSHISKWGGGIGVHVSNVRAKGSKILGTNGHSDGIIPMLQVYNSIARYVNQAGKRKGSFAMYLEPHHDDVFEFLELRKNTGAESERARDLFLALWVSDLFMKQVQVNGDWYLFCPNEAPKLNDVYGEEYEALYHKYVSEGKFRRKIKARKLWEAIQTAQFETGSPYMLYKDNINHKSNQKNIGTIKSSNLCVSPDTLVLTDTGDIPIYQLENQYVNIWNGEEWSNVQVIKTGVNQKLVRIEFNKENFLDCTPYHKFYIDVNGEIEVIPAMSLEKGMKLENWSTPNGYSTFDYISNVIPLEEIRDTYCFTEPKRHRGTFNGIVTGQCAEIVEYSDSKETASCNLASLSLSSFIKPKDISSEGWILYSKKNCPYCKWAETLLDNNKISFKKIMVEKDDDNYNLLKSKAKDPFAKITFPQIYHNEKLIGGMEELWQYFGKEFDYQKLWSVAYHTTINLDKVIDLNHYPTVEGRRSNMKHRPIGLGVQGLADVLAMMRIPYASDKTLEINKNIFGTIYHASLQASTDIAKEREEGIKLIQAHLKNHPRTIIEGEFYDPSFTCHPKKIEKLYHQLKPHSTELLLESFQGAYSTFNGSPFSQGKLQYHLWNQEPIDISIITKSDKSWTKLIEQIKTYGTRNSLLTALMPTASTSQLLSNYESFEPFTSNIYTRRTLAGEFVVVNKHLIRDLKELGEWSDNTKNMIIMNNGSISNLNLPFIIKNNYLTAYEMKQKWILAGCVARGPYIDQTQSMNLYFANPDSQKLTSAQFYAWKNGLKTGLYYLRSKPSTNAQKVTIDPSLVKKQQEDEDCLMCSA